MKKAVGFTWQTKLGFVLVAIALFASSMIVYSAHNIALAFSGSGDGSSGNPYMISSCDDLQSIKDDGDLGATSGKHYKLAASINCNTITNFDPITNFEGVFDGAGFTISNLTINRPSTDHVGLFSDINDSSSIVGNLTLSNVDVTGQASVGALAGRSYGNIVGVTVEGTVTASGQFAGGLVGFQQNGQVSRTSFNGTVDSSNSYTGGLIGYMSNSDIGTINSYATATVNGASYTGGLIGYMGGCCDNISNSYAAGTTTGTGNDIGGLVGGVDGYGNTSITNSFAAVEVSGNIEVAAFVGIVNGSNSFVFTNDAFDQTAAGTSVDITPGSYSYTGSPTPQNTDGNSPLYFFDSANEPLQSWGFTTVWDDHPASAYPTLLPIDELTGPGEVSNIDSSFPDSINEVYLTWDEPTNTGSFGISHYDIELKLNGDGWDTLQDSETNSDSNVYFSSLRLGQDYTARVRANTIYGTSDWVEFSFSTADAHVTNVSTCEQLMAIDDDSTSTELDTIKLTNNIDCSGIENFEPLGFSSGWSGDYFQGTFNGQGYTISNLHIDQDNYDVGLFSGTYFAVIKNVRLEGDSVSGSGSVGALVGEAEETNISNVQSNLSVTATIDGQAGGLVGYAYNDYENFDMVIEDSSSTGNVTGGYYVGGLIGGLEADYGKSITVRRSFATGNVAEREGESDYYFGGLIGYVESYSEDDGYDAAVIIEDTYASGNVSGYNYSGGLIGHVRADNDGYESDVTVTVQRSYASGDVSGYDYVGGFIGGVDSTYYAGQLITLENNFAVGSVSADDETPVGAFIGGYTEDSVPISSQENYYDTSTGYDCTGGDVIDSCTGIDQSVDTEYFKNNSTNAPFALEESPVWDFTNVWETTEGYPVLRAAVVDQSDSNDSGTAVNLNSAEDSTPISFSQTGCTTTDSSSVSKESALAAADPAFQYPVGFVSFGLSGCGSSANITLVFTGSFDVNKVVVRKYNSSNHSYTTLTTANSGLALTTTELNGKPALQVSYTVIDNGSLDQDATSGTIVDPVGIGLNVVGTPNTGLSS